jgi:hypothetical protein
MLHSLGWVREIKIFFFPLNMKLIETHRRLIENTKNDIIKSQMSASAVWAAMKKGIESKAAECE